MTTNYCHHQPAYAAELTRILTTGEIKRTPISEVDRATECEATAEMLEAMDAAYARFRADIIAEADDEVGALTVQERRDNFNSTIANLEPAYPFMRAANEYWQGVPSPPIQGAYDARQMGVVTGRGR